MQVVERKYEETEDLINHIRGDELVMSDCNAIIGEGGEETSRDNVNYVKKGKNNWNNCNSAKSWF